MHIPADDIPFDIWKLCFDQRINLAAKVGGSMNIRKIVHITRQNNRLFFVCIRFAGIIADPDKIGDDMHLVRVFKGEGFE
ncbi:hypothetical protein D3C76_1699470 [compost metagenome]